eukprot:1160080-Pelagomonas_calceolata.AAC.11
MPLPHFGETLAGLLVREPVLNACSLLASADFSYLSGMPLPHSTDLAQLWRPFPHTSHLTPAITHTHTHTHTWRCRWPCANRVLPGSSRAALEGGWRGHDAVRNLRMLVVVSSQQAGGERVTSVVVVVRTSLEAQGARHGRCQAGLHPPCLLGAFREQHDVVHDLWAALTSSVHLACTNKGRRGQARGDFLQARDDFLQARGDFLQAGGDTAGARWLFVGARGDFADKCGGSGRGGMHEFQAPGGHFIVVGRQQVCQEK